MDPVIGGILAVAGTLGGSILGYLGKSKQSDSDDKRSLIDSQKLMSDQLSVLFSQITTLTHEKKLLEALVDQLQDQVRSFRSALDRRDAQIKHLEQDLIRLKGASGGGIT